MQNDPTRQKNSQNGATAPRTTQYTSVRQVRQTNGSSSPVQNQRPTQRTVSSSIPDGTVRNPQTAVPNQQSVRSTADGSRLTSEERRRMEAARLAAMNSVKRSSDAENRLRVTEQTPRVKEQPIKQRATVSRTASQYREDEHRSTHYRKKKRVKINWGAILFVIIIAAVIGLSVWQITKNPTKQPNGNEGESGIVDRGTESAVEDPTETVADETEPPEDIPLVLYDTKIHLNKYIDVGYQILVNNDHAYARVDDVEITNVYSNRTGNLKVSGTAVGMEETAFRALEAMLAELTKQTGCDDLLLTSGYRTTADQQAIWDKNLAQSGEEYTKSYVAIPGHSEHHTGLACDLSFFTDDGATIPVADHEFGPWLWEHCSDYGFILRYLEDKENLTHIAYEPWHFRYVGFAHAKAIEHFGFCYEEYIAKLKEYTFETKMLYVKSDGTVSDVMLEAMPSSDGYLIYFAPMEAGESTQIKVPNAFAYDNVEISGNNVDGFIVTVTLHDGEI